MNKVIGVFILRSILALIFLMQGYGKVFMFEVKNVYQNFFLKQFESAFLPDWLLFGTAYYTSYVELFGGLFLLLGLFKNQTLYALGSVLIIVTFGHGLIEPIWDLHHVFVRSVFLVALLLLPQEWDKWCIDYIIKRKS